MKTKTGNFYLETGEMQLTLARTVREGILLSVHGEEEYLDGDTEYSCTSIVLNVAQAKELITELEKMIV